ncbi:SAC3 family protein LENG8/THP3 [Marchantia polymorpha subsp. ruderalis]
MQKGGVGMGTDYEKKRTSFPNLAAENTYSSESGSTWPPSQYEGWNYSNRSEFGQFPPSSAAAPSTSDSDPNPQSETTAAAAPQVSQPWFGYYSSQHLHHQPQQQGGQAQSNQGLPPLPSVPPPQPPPPPEPSTSLPSWSAVVAGTTETRATEGSGFPYSTYYNQQHQHGQESNFGGQDGQMNSTSSSSASAPGSNANSNGSHNYGQVYAGYTSSTPGDQYSYGGGNYSNYNYGYPQQQGNDSYSQNMGTPYQSSGAAPYPPVNSFSSTSSYTDSTSYQSTGTYYNAGVYQNTGGYPTSNYSSHPSSWSDNSYGSYGGYPGYSGYSATDQSNAAGSGAVSNAGQYQHDYQPQWAEYYANMQNNPNSSTDTNSAPGTAPTSTPPPSYASVVAQGTGTQPVSANSSQPPPPGTQPAWQPNNQPSSAASQANTTSTKVGSNWDPMSLHASQADSYNHNMQSHFQGGPPTQNSMSKVQSQLSAPPGFQQVQISQSSQVQQPLKQQTQLDVPTSHGFQSQGHQQMNSGISHWRTSKMQIPNNPRIASNLGMAGKGSFGMEGGPKPAYISVGSKAGKLTSDDVTDATLQPGMFPPALRAYVERALSRCKDEAQKSACQDIMKEMITTASRDGSLFTKDWDTEPLFPLPNLPSASTGKDATHRGMAPSGGMKMQSSPNKRMKSRWEPVGDDEMDDKHTLGNRDSIKDSLRDRHKERDGSASPPKWEKREGLWNKSKLVQQQHSAQSNLGKRTRKVPKRGRRLGSFNGYQAVSSSESDEEVEQIGGVTLGALTTAETPEEKKRRQSRTKRFDRGKETTGGAKGVGKGKAGVGGSATARRATALQLAMTYGDGNGRAVEDIDWDSLTVRGTCQEIEKRYLRLTSAPDPSTVRPEDILRKALAMVQSTSKSYLYRCEQLKSIRQDLTVQRIRDELTVQVYETHARMALEAGDLPEYNQCQTQLKGLYAEGIKGCINEFAAYSLLYIIFNHGNSRDLLSSMARLSRDARKDEAVKHALAVRAALASGNYTSFFKLYRTAPNLSPFLMEIHAEKMRFEAVKCMARSYRPSLPITFIARSLGFMAIEGGEDKEADGIEECEEWLKLHGAHLIFDSVSNESVLDTKTSATTLFMPEPEDAVPHGDANLALNDFFARS